MGAKKTVHKMFGEIDFRLSPTDLLQLPLKEMDLNLSLESLSKVFNSLILQLDDNFSWDPVFR